MESLDPLRDVSDDLVALVVVKEEVKAFRVVYTGGGNFRREPLEKPFHVPGV